MTRNDFIDYFKIKYPEYFGSKATTLNLDYYLEKADSNSVMGLLIINSKLDDIYEELNIKKPYYLKKDDVKIEYDYYHDDENPDSNVCRYTSTLNLNSLYDKLLLNNSIKSDLTIDIYRLEELNGNGLYSGVGYNILKNSPEYNQPGPDKESKFFNIFPPGLTGDNQSYKREWSFGFSDTSQIKEWLDNSLVLHLLKEENFVLKKITVDANFAIIGDSQAIYKKEGIKSIEIQSLDTLDGLFKPEQIHTRKKLLSMG